MQSVQNEDDEEINCLLISPIALHDLFQIWYVDLPT